MNSSANGGTPRTAGHALHDLVERVRGSGQSTILGGWTTVLGARTPTVEWCQRHAEVVGLYQSVLQQLLSLPEDEPSRVRALRYAPAWYRAVVWVEHWQNTAQPASVIIDEADLDQLGSTADFLAYRLPSTAAHPTGDSIARLREEVNAWIDLLDETGDLPESTRTEIAGQMRHVLWLLDNIDTFGAGPVVRETQVAVGKVTEAMVTRPSGSLWKNKWVRRFGGLLAALALINQGLEATNQALESAKSTLTVVGEIVREGDAIVDSVSDRPALPSGTADTGETEEDAG